MFTIIYPKGNHGELGRKIEKALNDLKRQDRCGRFKNNVKQYTKKNETKKKQKTNL
jgi:predicted secreted Zn-dependent protease